MDTWQRIIELARSQALPARYAGLIDAAEHPAGGLLLLNYTQRCQYERVWDEVTMWCRGLIIDNRSWRIVGVPFRKFFNLGERPESSLEALPREPFTVYEKLDGSLGISYRRDGEIALASRGSFISREAVQGTAFLRRLMHVESLPESLTFLFEVICGDHRCVTRYDSEGLVLLAIFELTTGRELDWIEVQTWAERLGCRTPTVYPFGNLEDVLASRARLPSKLEGYVIRFASGFRVKVKGDAYLALHKLAAGLTEERILEELAQGRIASFCRQVPEEFRPDIERTISELEQQTSRLEATVRDLFERTPQGSDRKAFALWVQANAPVELRGLLFQLLDGKAPNWCQALQSARMKDEVAEIAGKPPRGRTEA